MTLGEERELEKIKDCLSYVLVDKHSDAPHWDAAYPWKADPAILPDNRRAVEATFRNTEARLAREPVWKAAYGEQIREMVSRGAAIRLLLLIPLRAGRGRSGTSAIWSPRILILAQRQ